MASSESLHGVSVTGAEPAVESATNSEQAATNAVNAPLCRSHQQRCSNPKYFGEKFVNLTTSIPLLILLNHALWY